MNMRIVFLWMKQMNVTFKCIVRRDSEDTGVIGDVCHRLIICTMNTTNKMKMKKKKIRLTCTWTVAWVMWSNWLPLWKASPPTHSPFQRQLHRVWYISTGGHFNSILDLHFYSHDNAIFPHPLLDFCVPVSQRMPSHRSPLHNGASTGHSNDLHSVSNHTPNSCHKKTMVSSLLCVTLPCSSASVHRWVQYHSARLIDTHGSLFTTYRHFDETTARSFNVNVTVFFRFQFAPFNWCIRRAI